MADARFALAQRPEGQGAAVIGWFLAAEPGTCDGCGKSTKINESVYYQLGDERLCVECAP